METLSFILLFIAVIASNASATCTSAMDIYEEIEPEKNDRGYYFSNRHYTWNKCTLADHRFVIEIQHFDLERKWGQLCDDYLKITDKKTGKLIINRCGFSNPAEFKSDSNRIKIEFHTDNFQSNNTGFKLLLRTEAIEILSTYEAKTVTTFQKETKNGNFTRLLQTESRKTKTQTNTISKSKIKHESEQEVLLSTKSSKPSYASSGHPKKNQNIHRNSRSVTTMELGTSVLITSAVRASGQSSSSSTYEYVATSVVTTKMAKGMPSTNEVVISTSFSDGNTTQITSGHGAGSQLYLIGIIIGGVLIEMVIVSFACSMYKRRGKKRWSVKTLSRTKKPSEIQTLWKRPQSLALFYNERISTGNIYSEINIQEMTSFSNNSIKNKEIDNTCPYKEVSCHDGEYDHLRKKREKRKSILSKINEYGFHRISTVFKNN